MEINIGEAIKIALDRKKMRVSDLSEKLGMTQPTFRTRLEKGGWRDDELKIIEKELGVVLEITIE